MTGTVVQNSLDDLASLISFLRVPLLEDPTNFRKYVSGRKTTCIMQNPNYANLKLLLGSICLRRSTSSVLFTLGVKFEERRQSFVEAERQAYDDLAISCGQSIKAVVNTHSDRQGNTSILTAVLKLRIFCNTGFASPMDATSDNVEDQLWPDEIDSLHQQGGEDIHLDDTSDILASITENRLTKPHEFSQHRPKPENHTQSTAIMGDAEVMAGDKTGILSIRDSNMMEDVQYEVERDSALTIGLTQYESYPAKLKALLIDIKEHYDQDKR